jgi:hypothetical protein
MSISADNSKLAQDILNALSTTNNPNVPEASHPGEPPAADQPASSHARYGAALDAYHSHLNNLPASAFSDFPSDSAETRVRKATMRRDLFAASVAALGLR